MPVWRRTKATAMGTAWPLTKTWEAGGGEAVVFHNEAVLLKLELLQVPRHLSLLPLMPKMVSDRREQEFWPLPRCLLWFSGGPGHSGAHSLHTYVHSVNYKVRRTVSLPSQPPSEIIPSSPPVSPCSNLPLTIHADYLIPGSKPFYRS